MVLQRRLKRLTDCVSPPHFGGVGLVVVAVLRFETSFAKLQHRIGKTRAFGAAHSVGSVRLAASSSCCLPPAALRRLQVDVGLASGR